MGRIPGVGCARRNASLICFWPGVKPGSDMFVTRVCQLVLSFSFKIPLKKITAGSYGNPGRKRVCLCSRKQSGRASRIAEVKAHDGSYRAGSKSRGKRVEIVTRITHY